MPFRIRCVKCGHEMLIPEQRSGTNLNCPDCNALFTIPVVFDVQRPAVDLGAACPHCSHSNAPGTTTCRQCGSDLITGKRAPLGKRLSLWFTRRWALLLSFAAVTLALGFVIYRIVGSMPSEDQTQQTDPNQVVPAASNAMILIETLFAATDPNQRMRAFRDVRNQGLAIQEPFARLLVERLSSDQRVAEDEAVAELAIELFLTFDQPDEFVIDALAACTTVPGLRQEALLARGSFGDMGAADELRDWWLELLEREIFLSAMVDLDSTSQSTWSEGLSVVRDRRRQVTQSLRRLVQVDVHRSLAPVAEHYWRSWRWLGQERGEQFADALFELAMPFRGRLSVLAADEDEAKQAIRAARSTLSELGERGDPLAAAAAGVAMVRNAPQYGSARDRIVVALLSRMSALRASDQQRVIWALARLTGRLFGSYSSDSPPWEVTPEVAAEVVKWARKEHGIDITPASGSPWMQPVMLEYTVQVIDPNQPDEPEAVNVIDPNAELQD
jgi:hypothetical protein